MRYQFHKTCHIFSTGFVGDLKVSLTVAFILKGVIVAGVGVEKEGTSALLQLYHFHRPYTYTTHLATKLQRSKLEYFLVQNYPVGTMSCIAMSPSSLQLDRALCRKSKYHHWYLSVDNTNVYPSRQGCEVCAHTTYGRKVTRGMYIAMQSTLHTYLYSWSNEVYITCAIGRNVLA